MLNAESSSNADQGLELDTDDAGAASFYFTPVYAIADSKFFLNCQGWSGGSGTYPVEMTASTDVPALVAPPPRTTGYMRPALTGDPLAPTNEELVAAGYPPRPDPVQTPSGYQTWLKLVSQPAAQAAVKLVPSKRRADAINTTGHAGYAVHRTGTHYYSIAWADWTVPSLNSDYGHQDYASFWLGLGGYYGQGDDMWQGGLEHDVLCLGGGCTRTTFPWVELVTFTPQVPTQTGRCCGMVGFDGFPFNTYDEVAVELWFQDANGNVPATLPSSPLYAWWFIENASTSPPIYSMDYGGWWYIDSDGYWEAARDPNSHVQNDGRVPSFMVNTVTGQSAEWIVERPQVPASNCPRLAAFSNTLMMDVMSYDGAAGWLYYGSQSNTKATMCHADQYCNMVTPCQKLAEASPATPATSTIQFFYRAHQ
jgi:hypothetical protein